MVRCSIVSVVTICGFVTGMGVRSYGQQQAASEKWALHHVETQLDARTDNSRLANRHRFLAIRQVTGERKEITVYNRMTEVIRVAIYRDRGVVLGRYRNASDVVIILNLNRGMEADFFLCFRPTLSPSKRHLLYEKFYTRHRVRELRFGNSTILLAYDLEKSPADNRIAESNERAVGIPVYPEENRERRTYWPLVQNEELVHHVAPIYVWLDSGHTVLFVDRFDSSSWLVALELPSALDDARIRKRRINVAQLLADEPGSAEYRRSLRRAETFLPVKDLRASTTGRVTLVLGLVGVRFSSITRSKPTAFQAVSFKRVWMRMGGWKNIGEEHIRFTTSSIT